MNTPQMSSLPHWRQSAAGVWSDPERQSLLSDLSLPAWLPQPVAFAVQDLYTWFTGREEERWKPELARIANDDRLRSVWVWLNDAYQAEKELRGTIPVDPERWIYELARRLLLQMTYKAGNMPTKTETKMRSEREALADKLHAFRNQVRRTEDPTLTKLSLGELLRRIEKEPSESGKTARSLDRVTKWMCAGISMDELLQCLEDGLRSGDPLSAVDDIEHNPLQPVNRGAKHAHRNYLQNVIIANTWTLAFPPPADMIEAMVDVAFDETDPRKSRLTNRQHAEQSKRRRTTFAENQR
ncbi:MAG: hypothetical protein K9L82_17340 [Chromatiaceae bacterium]|nr:hypothetical protein [Chromatiaceae bacterium]